MPTTLYFLFRYLSSGTISLFIYSSCFFSLYLERPFPNFFFFNLFFYYLLFIMSQPGPMTPRCCSTNLDPALAKIKSGPLIPSPKRRFIDSKISGLGETSRRPRLRLLRSDLLHSEAIFSPVSFVNLFLQFLLKGEINLVCIAHVFSCPSTLCQKSTLVTCLDSHQWRRKNASLMLRLWCEHNSDALLHVTNDHLLRRMQLRHVTHDHLLRRVQPRRVTDDHLLRRVQPRRVTDGHSAETHFG
jgi:hypothetical protein